jgi:hypothetical protein
LLNNLIYLLPIYKLIFLLRYTGHDTKLRAGQTVDWLVLSRSKLHGLRPDQASLTIIADPDQEKLTVRYQNGTSEHETLVDPPTSDFRLATSDLETVKQLQELIDRLAALPID